jgi:hypothetical protein
VSIGDKLVKDKKRGEDYFSTFTSHKNNFTTYTRLDFGGGLEFGLISLVI